MRNKACSADPAGACPDAIGGPAAGPNKPQTERRRLRYPTNLAFLRGFNIGILSEQTQQVVENIDERPKIGQNNPNFGHFWGSSADAVFGPAVGPNTGRRLNGGVCPTRTRIGQEKQRRRP